MLPAKLFSKLQLDLPHLFMICLYAIEKNNIYLQNKDWNKTRGGGVVEGENGIGSFPRNPSPCGESTKRSESVLLAERIGAAWPTRPLIGPR